MSCSCFRLLVHGCNLMNTNLSKQAKPSQNRRRQHHSLKTAERRKAKEVLVLTQDYVYKPVLNKVTHLPQRHRANPLQLGLKQTSVATLHTYIHLNLRPQECTHTLTCKLKLIYALEHTPLLCYTESFSLKGVTLAYAHCIKRRGLCMLSMEGVGLEECMPQECVYVCGKRGGRMKLFSVAQNVQIKEKKYEKENYRERV